MNEKTLTTLEFNKIRDYLKGKCISEMGRQMAHTLTPSNDITQINLWQDETTQAADMIVKKGSLPLGGIRDIREGVKRAQVSGVLSAGELMNVSDFLYVCRKVITYGKADKDAAALPVLRPLFDSVTPLTQLESEINRCIAPPDEITDGASHELAQIRRNISVANGRIREQLNSIIHSQSYKNMLQDGIVTIRSDRFCVPVKQEYVKAFPGMVHDTSQTGATVFMEPTAVINLNNQLKELHAKEKLEIERILRALSGLVADDADCLLSNTGALTHLDFIFAKGELSLSQNGARPEFNANGYIEIRKGRHPLLNPETVVPTDVYLGRDFTTLLITGPNTGGKTVTLKTIGLFTLMGQAGLHIGAKEGSVLAVFDSVFADIGDEQSIEQSLSTFSSHMSNIVNILSQVTRNSLVLLDELGAGTDPTEGAALAISILERLRRDKIRAAVTTHYSELKIYALSTEGVINASCEFDVKTLRPTYKLLIGIPGKSNAFEISRRIGLNEDIIKDAAEILSKEDIRFEDVITDLEISKKTALMEKERAEGYRAEAEKLKKEFEAEKAKTEAMRETIILKAKNEARQLYDNARLDADALLREYKRSLKENKQHEINEARRKITEKAAEPTEEEQTYILGESLEQTGKALNKGDLVVVAGINKQGVVTALPDTGGEAQVQVGAIKMKVHISKLYDIKPQAKKPEKTSVTVPHVNKAINIRPEIDLRGMTIGEGIEACDKYLDDAYLSSLSQVTIIHGKGTGALRNAIQTHLKRHPHVKGFRYGGYGEGGDGVTVAEIRG